MLDVRGIKFLALARLIGLLCAFPTAARAETFNDWSFTVPTSTSGVWSASEANNSVSLSGTFSRLANSFLKLTVTAASGPGAPAINDVRYALEAPGFSFFVEPTLSAETRVLSTAVTGTCPSTPWTGNFILTQWPTGFNAGNSVSFGTFTWTPSTNNLRIDTGYSLGGYTLVGSNVDVPGTCSNGIITLSGVGDRGGKIYLTNRGGAVYVVNTAANAKIMYALPRASIPSASVIAGNFSTFSYNHDSTPVRLNQRTIIDSTPVAGPRNLTDVDTNTTNTNGFELNNVVLNSPTSGFFTADLVSVSGGVPATCSSNCQAVCMVYITNRVVIGCVARDAADNTKPYNLVMVSDLQTVTGGTTDTYGFNSTGKIVTSFGTDDAIYGIALQSDQKIVTVGSSASAPGLDLIVQRLNADGTLDTSFDGDGASIKDIGGSFYEYGYSVGIQTDGKIVAAGTSDMGTYIPKPFVARFTSTGALDTTFYGVGFRVTTITAFGSDYGKELVIDSGNRAIVAADGYNGGSYNLLYLLRHTSAGAMDTTFGASGIVTYTNSAAMSVGALSLMTDSSLVVSGTEGTKFAFWRFGSNGVIDSTFGTSGKTTVSVGTSGSLNAMAVQNDGKIIGVGCASGSNCDFAIVRLTTTGALDTTFGSGTGQVTYTVGSNDDTPKAVAVQTDGKIIVAGSSQFATLDVSIVRLTSTGAKDTTFATGGTYTTSISTPNYTDHTESIWLQGDGKIVVGGRTESSAGFGTYNGFILRLWGN